MKSDLDDQLVELLSKANSGIDTAVSFSKEQIPELIEQTLLWYQLYYVSMFLLALLMVPATYLLLKYLVPKFKKELDLDSDKAFPLIVLIIVSIVAMLITFFSNINLEWVQIYIAPKLWLIEYINGLK